MGTRVIYAICKDCEKNNCKKCKNKDYQFPVELEWMTKKELIDHIKITKCPCCGSANWILTDYSEI